jgi:hypothetical protein
VRPIKVVSASNAPERQRTHLAQCPIAMRPRASTISVRGEVEHH